MRLRDWILKSDLFLNFALTHYTLCQLLGKATFFLPQHQLLFCFSTSDKSTCLHPLSNTVLTCQSSYVDWDENWIVHLKWYYTVICLENGETPDWADMIHRYLSKLVLDLTHLWLNLGYQTCISFLLKFWKCFGDFDQVLLNLLLVSTLRHSL